MKTGSLRTYHKIGSISIARWAGKYGAGVPTYRPLAPGPWFKSVTWERYVELYSEQLSALDPRKTFEALERIAAPHEPVLLCWELPPFVGDNHCHRRLVATWFEQRLGLTVPEIDP